MASVFSGRAGRQTAIWTAQQAQAQYDQLRSLYDTGWDRARGALTEGYDQARPLMRSGYEAQRAGTTRARADLRQGYITGRGDMGLALRDLNKAYGRGIQTQRQAVNAWTPLHRENMAGYNMFGDAMGTHGAEGQARARASFQAGPGYQWMVDQGSDAAARSANARGLGYSGNTTDAITRLGSNLANQEWGSHLDRLQSYQGAAQASTAGRAGAFSDLAQMYGQMGQGQANIRQNMGGQAFQYGAGQAANSVLAGNNAGQYYGNMANLEMNQGQTMANAATGQMNDNAGALNQYYGTVLPAGQQGLQAGQQAAANRFGAIMGGIQMGMGALGMGMPTGNTGGIQTGGGSVGGSMAGGFGTFLKGLFG